MKEQELKMLRQFVDTVFDLTHALDNSEEPAKKAELLRSIGSLAYSAQNVCRFYQELEVNND